MGHTHGTQWTDELVKQKVLEVIEAMKLDRMPSRKECENYFHGTGLTNVISRRYGWYNLAKELGFDIKESETRFGKTYEARATEMLQGMGFEVRRMSQNFPYDLLVDDCVKIDVKASRLYRGKQGNFYSFNLEKSFATCDFFLLLAVSDEDTIERKMVVPSSCVIANNQISIGEHKSKYYQFTDRFDLVENAVAFWLNLAKEVG
jgi:hypothetical protein